MKSSTDNNFLNQLITDDLRYKFMALPQHQKTRLVNELHQTFLLGIRALVVENLTGDEVKAFEAVVKNEDDDGIMLFGFKNIPDFASKLDGLKTKIQSAFLQELKN